MVSSDGIVTWLSTGIFRSSCAFASWTYDSARIDLSQKTNIGDLSNLMANSGRLSC